MISSNIEVQIRNRWDGSPPITIISPPLSISSMSLEVVRFANICDHPERIYTFIYPVEDATFQIYVDVFHNSENPYLNVAFKVYELAELDHTSTLLKAKLYPSGDFIIKRRLGKGFEDAFDSGWFGEIMSCVGDLAELLRMVILADYLTPKVKPTVKDESTVTANNSDENVFVGNYLNTVLYDYFKLDGQQQKFMYIFEQVGKEAFQMQVYICIPCSDDAREVTEVRVLRTIHSMGRFDHTDQLLAPDTARQMREYVEVMMPRRMLAIELSKT